MAKMDTVCNQRFDDNLSLIIENKQNDSWKEVWKNMPTGINGAEVEMHKEAVHHSTVENDGASSSLQRNNKSEIIENCESLSTTNKVCDVRDEEMDADNTCPDYASNAIEIDEDEGNCGNNDDGEEDDDDDDVVIDNEVGLNKGDQGEKCIKVCEVSNCSFYGKPDPLVPIKKVDYDSNDLDSPHLSSLCKGRDKSSATFLDDINDTPEDDLVEESHQNVDMMDSNNVAHSTRQTNAKHIQQHKFSKSKSPSRGIGDSDVVQISSGDEDDEDDDDESVNSLFSLENTNVEVLKKPTNPSNHSCSMVILDVPDLNIVAMKAGQISCSPSHDCIVFNDLNNHLQREVAREVAVHMSCLESHQWVSIFGGLVLDMTLNLTGCQDSIMAFFQVPHLKFARFYMRFPPSVMRIYFEARLVDLTLRHDFQQFLNTNIYSHSRAAPWQPYDKHQQMTSYNQELYHSHIHHHNNPGSNDHLHSKRNKSKSDKVIKSSHPYHMKICRSNKAPTKSSYYKPPKWPYIQKVADYRITTRKTRFPRGVKRPDFEVSNFDNSSSTGSGHWMVNSNVTQSYYHQQSHFYTGQPYMGGCDYMGSGSLGLNAFNSMDHLHPHNQLQHPPNIGMVHSNHHQQTNQWFNRIGQAPSPVYVNSGFQGAITKLFTYRPPGSKGGINVTNEDLFCLNDGEYLNDVIIDFYLQYLMQEVISDEDKLRTHIFSSFFYGHLISGNSLDPSSVLTPEEQRHRKVKTWTRHVDIFSKDFIIVPINESYHWFLAIICFPNVAGFTKCKSSLELHCDINLPDTSSRPPTSEQSTSQPIGCVEKDFNETKSGGIDVTNGGDNCMESIDNEKIVHGGDKLVPQTGEVDLKSNDTNNGESLIQQHELASQQMNCISSVAPCESSADLLDVRNNEETSNECDSQSGRILLILPDGSGHQETVETQHPNEDRVKDDLVCPPMCEENNRDCVSDDNGRGDDAVVEITPMDISTSENEACGDASNKHDFLLSRSLPDSFGDDAGNKETQDAKSEVVPGVEGNVTGNNETKVDETSLDEKEKNDNEKYVSNDDDECNPRNPCILIFDSLKGDSRYDVVNILRQYLQVEWNFRKRATEGDRVFDKFTMKGSMVNCPQQPNSSDCGIYVLQFVESFFMNPTKDFTLPLSLVDWFTSKQAMSKRYHLAKFIMRLKDELSPSLDYNPATDGCFNIAPLLSDDEDESVDDDKKEPDADDNEGVDDVKEGVEESCEVDSSEVTVGTTSGTSKIEDDGSVHSTNMCFLEHK